MKIVSPFNDYYDSIQSSTGFFDTSENPVVFVRKSVILNKDNFNEMDQLIDVFQVETLSRYIYTPPAALVEIGGSFSIPKKNQRDYTSLTFSFFSILFCGRLIRGIESTLSFKSFDPLEQKTFYSAEKFVDYLYERFGESVVNERLEENRTPSRSMMSGIINYFDVNDKKDLPEYTRGFLIENKITIAVLNLTRDIFRGIPFVEINPRLADYQFQSFIDPYTAYQEIDMWISGILAFPPNFMVTVSDQTLVKKHGFDEEYGFRTRPHAKKRKRQ
jgi:hypothetical protein